MTINKLLAGAAVAALLAGAAQAQVVNTTAGGSSTALPESGVAFIASEFQPAAAVDQLAGSLVITSNFGATAPFAAIPVDGRARLTISLTNGTFTTAGAASFTGNSGTNCAFETAAVTGGGIGSTSVGFISTAGAAINACTSATGESGVGNADGGIIGTFTIPVVRTANGAPVEVTLTYTQVNADGSAVVSPVTSAETIDYADIEGAWDSTPANATDHQFTAGAELLASNAGILAAGTLGTVEVDFRTTGTGALDIREDDGSAVLIGDLLGDANEIQVTFPGGADNIATVAIAGGIGCTGPVLDVFTCDVTATEMLSLTTAAAITYTVAGVLIATPEQTPTATLTTDPQANYVLAGFSGDLADIKHDNGLRTEDVAGGGTESNFRISVGAAGVPDAAAAAGITEVRVSANEGNGVTGGTITLLPGTADTGFQIQGSTVTFNSRALGAVSGDSGNANITNVEFQYDESVTAAVDVSGATIERQLVNRSPGTFVATPGLVSDN